MAKMSATTAAMNFGSDHAERYVAGRSDPASIQARPKARPAGSTFKLGLGGKDILAATGAAEHPFAVLIEQGLVNGYSVPSFRRIEYWSPVRSLRHASSVAYGKSPGCPRSTGACRQTDTKSDSTDAGCQDKKSSVEFHVHHQCRMVARLSRLHE
jgi:hypothetical protein